MILNNLIKRAHKFKGLTLDCYDNKKINNNLIDLLNLCIKNNITLTLNERDIVKIMRVYSSITDKYYEEFIIKIINLSKKELNIKRIYELF